jgi:hypothetical protein
VVAPIDVDHDAGDPGRLIGEEEQGRGKTDGVHDMMNQVAIVSLAGGFSATNFTPGTLAA